MMGMGPRGGEESRGVPLGNGPGLVSHLGLGEAAAFGFVSLQSSSG